MAEKIIKVKVTPHVADFVKDMAKVQSIIDDLQNTKTSGQLTNPAALAKIQQVVGSLQKVMGKAQADLSQVPELASAFGEFSDRVKKVVHAAADLAEQAGNSTSGLSKLDKSALPKALESLTDRVVTVCDNVIEELATIGSETLKNADVVELRKLRTHKFITSGSDLKKAVKQQLAVLDSMAEAERKIAIDTEGGNTIRKTGRTDMRTAQVKIKGQIPLLIDFDQIPKDQWKPFWDLIASKHTKVLHNARYDLEALKANGAGEVGGKIEDTLMLARGLAKLYSLLGESSITGGKGQALDVLMNSLTDRPEYSNLKNIFGSDKFSKELRSSERWSEQNLAKDLQAYAVSDVEGLPHLMEFLSKLRDEALAKLYTPEQAAKIRQQMDARMDSWSREYAEKNKFTDSNTLVRREVQNDIEDAIKAMPKATGNDDDLPNAFKSLQRATTAYKTGVYKLIGRTREVVMHMVSNADTMDAKLVNNFDAMESGTRTLQGSNAVTKNQLIKYIDMVHGFTANLPTSSLKEALTGHLKNINSRSNVGQLKKTAADIVNTWSAAIEEAVKHDSLNNNTFAYKGISNLPSSNKNMKAAMGGTQYQAMIHAGSVLNNALTNVFEDYGDTINKAVPYLDPDVAPIKSKMDRLLKAVLDAVDATGQAIDKVKEEGIAGNQTGRNEAVKQAVTIAGLPAVNSLSKSFLESARAIKTDDPSLQRVLDQLPEDLNQLGDKALAHVVAVVKAIERQVNEIGKPRINADAVSAAYKTKPLQQMELPEVAKNINNTSNWKSLTAFGDIKQGTATFRELQGVTADQLKDFTAVMQKLTDLHVPVRDSGLKISQMSVEGLKKPIEIVGTLPMRFRKILDNLFENEKAEVERISHQLGVVESQLLKNVLDKDALSNAGLNDIEDIKDLGGVEQLKGKLQGSLQKNARTRGLKMFNALKQMAPFIGNIDKAVGEEMFALSNMIDDMADRIKSTSRSIGNEHSLIDAKNGTGSRSKLARMETALKGQLAEFHRIEQQSLAYISKLMMSPDMWNKAIASDPELKNIEVDLQSTIRKAFTTTGKSWKERAFENKDSVDGASLNEIMRKATELSREDVIKQLGMPEEAGGLPSKLDEIKDAIQSVTAQKKAVHNAIKHLTEAGIFDNEYDSLVKIEAQLQKHESDLRNGVEQIQKFIGNNKADAVKANIWSGVTWAKQQANDNVLLENYRKQLATITDPTQWEKVNKAYQAVLARSAERTRVISTTRQESQGKVPQFQASPFVQRVQQQLKASQDVQSHLTNIQHALMANTPESISIALTQMRGQSKLKDFADDLISNHGDINIATEQLTLFGSNSRKQLEQFINAQVTETQNEVNQLRAILGKNKRFRLQRGVAQTRALMDANGVKTIGELPALLRDSVSDNLQQLSSELTSEAQLLKTSTARGRLTEKAAGIKEKMAALKERINDGVSLGVRRALEAQILGLDSQLKFLSTSWKPITVIENMRSQVSSLANVKAEQDRRLDRGDNRLQLKQTMLKEGNLSLEDSAKLEKHIAVQRRVIEARKEHITTLVKEIGTIKSYINTYDQDMGQFSIINRELKETERRIERIAITKRDALMKQDPNLSSADAFGLATLDNEVKELITSQQGLLAQKQKLSQMFKGEQINDLSTINKKVLEVKGNIAKMVSGDDSRTAHIQGPNNLEARTKLAYATYGPQLTELNKMKDAVKAVDDAAGGGSGGGGGGSGSRGRGFFGTLTKIAVTLGSITFMFRTLQSSVTGLVTPGLQFLSTLETSRIGFASILVSLTKVNNQTLSWSQGMALAGDVIERVQQSAMLTGQSVADLLKLVQGLMGSGLSGNMSIDQVVKFATVGSAAIRQIGMDSSQMIQELRDMVQGGIQAQSSVLATNLGITDADVERARSTGKLFEMLMSRMQGFEQGIDAYMGTLAGRFNIIREGLTRIMGEGLRPLYNMINSVLGELIGKLFDINELLVNKTIKPNPEIIKDIKKISSVVVQLIQDFRNLGEALAPAFNLVYGIVSRIMGLLNNGSMANGAIAMLTAFLAFKPLMRAFGATTEKNSAGVDVRVTGVKRAERDLARFRSSLTATTATIAGGITPALRGIGPMALMASNGIKVLAAALVRLTSRTIVGALVTISTILVSEGILALLEKMSGTDKKRNIVESAATPVKTRGDLDAAVQERGNTAQKSQMESLAKQREDLRTEFSNLGSGLGIEEFRSKLADNLKQSADVALEVYSSMLDVATAELTKFSEHLSNQLTEVTDEYGDVRGTLGVITAEDEAHKAKLAADIKNIQAQIDIIRDLRKSSNKEASAMSGVQGKNRQVDAQEMESLKSQEEAFWSSRIQNAQKVAESEINLLKARLDNANNRFQLTIKDYYKKRFEYEDRIYEARRNALIAQQARQEKLLNLELSSGSTQGITTSGNKEIDKFVAEAAKLTGVSERLIFAVMKQESSFNPNAKSPVGAIGLMQLMPDTAGELGVDPLNIRENIIGGAKYLSQQLDTFNGDLVKAIAAYNAGPGAVQYAKGVPNYPETQDYVTKVMANFKGNKAIDHSVISSEIGTAQMSKIDQLLNADNIDPRYKEILETAKQQLGQYASRAASVQKMIAAIKVEASREDTEAQLATLGIEHQMAKEALTAAQLEAEYQLKKSTMGFWASYQETFGQIKLDGFWQPIQNVFKGNALDVAMAGISQDWHAGIESMDLSAVPAEMRTMLRNDVITFMEQHRVVIQRATAAELPAINAALKETFEMQQLEKYWQRASAKMDAITSLATRRFNQFASQLANDLSGKLGANSYAEEVAKYVDKISTQVTNTLGEYTRLRDNAKIGADDPRTIAALEKYISLIEQLSQTLAAAGDNAFQLAKSLQQAKIDNDWTQGDNEKAFNKNKLDRDTAPKQQAIYEQQIVALNAARDRLLAAAGDDQILKDAINRQYDTAINQIRVKQEQLKGIINNPQVKIFGQELWITHGELFQQTLSGMSGALMDLATGTKSASDAFRNMAYNIISSLQQIVAEMLAKKIMLAMFNFLGLPTGATGGLVSNGSIKPGMGDFKSLDRYAGGGPINGPGTGTSDDILAWLSNGEFVLKAKAVQKYGRNFINALNQGMVSKNNLPRFAEGGEAGYSYTGSSYDQAGNPIEPDNALHALVVSTLSAVKEVKSDTVKLIRMMQIHALSAMLGPLGGIFTALAGFAGGGAIIGAGTGTSDSILARLSNGEFVLRAAAVRKYGTSYINALNKGIIPTTQLPRFAVGGLVGAGATSSGSGSGNASAESILNNLQIVNVLDPSIVGNFMSSSSGRKVVMNVIENNKTSIRRLLK